MRFPHSSNNKQGHAHVISGAQMHDTDGFPSGAGNGSAGGAALQEEEERSGAQSLSVSRGQR